MYTAEYMNLIHLLNHSQMFAISITQPTHTHTSHARTLKKNHPHTTQMCPLLPGVCLRVCGWVCVCVNVHMCVTHTRRTHAQLQANTGEHTKYTYIMWVHAQWATEWPTRENLIFSSCQWRRRAHCMCDVLHHSTHTPLCTIFHTCACINGVHSLRYGSEWVRMWVRTIMGKPNCMCERCAPGARPRAFSLTTTS